MTVKRYLGSVMVGACTFLGASAASAKHQSRQEAGARVTYREPNICETTPGVKSYSGYVTLPYTSLQDYEQNMFFWFFEARQDPHTAPLTVWVQGGPGSASIDQALSENGPCTVNADSNSTTLNPWSWNNHANVLYIDSPVQAGFSYDSETVEGVVDWVRGDIHVDGTWGGPLNYTAIKGTFASQNPEHTVGTTAVAAETIYDTVQAFLGEFEHYRRDSISIWSQSYGGHYAPSVASLFHERSKAASETAKHELDCGSQPVPKVHSVGIINGLIDLIIMGPHFPYFPVNNTYGIQAYDNASVADAAWDSWHKQGGCRDMIQDCKAVSPGGYHGQAGANETVNEVCSAALAYCGPNVYFTFDQMSTHDHFDITQHKPTPEIAPYAIGFLQRPWVLEALGAKVNYTANHNPTTNAFMMTGDFVQGGFIEDLAHLVDDGVKVALIYGDRDYRCNWVAGEAVSIEMEHSKREAFNIAGYAEMLTNDSYVGGLVRQYDNFSFTRVLQAGHSIGYYQPETAYQLFQRTIEGRDIATGRITLGTTGAGGAAPYATEGPASVFDVKSELPPQREQFCYVGAPLALTCSDEQIVALYAGTAEVGADLVVVSPGLL